MHHYLLYSRLVLGLCNQCRWESVVKLRNKPHTQMAGHNRSAFLTSAGRRKCCALSIILMLPDPLWEWRSYLHTMRLYPNIWCSLTFSIRQASLIRLKSFCWSRNSPHFLQPEHLIRFSQELWWTRIFQPTSPHHVSPNYVIFSILQIFPSAPWSQTLLP
jgi:hypothetical protein